MSQSPASTAANQVDASHPYAAATAKLNRLVRLGRSFSGHERNGCFLNDGLGRFANASAVSGLHFDDDGRCVVRGDWDFDGDVDLWVSNRTAPRLRFLRNTHSPKTGKVGSDFVALRLVGTKSNRDAIGAKVRIRFEDVDKNGAGKITLVKSVRRGEGFLGQSSSWLHFGLGSLDSQPSENALTVEVRWPNASGQSADTWESFEQVTADGFFVLTEGTGQAEPWSPPTIESSGSAPALIKSVEPDEPLHHLFGQSAPLPALPYTNFAGTQSDAAQVGKGMTLLNLWASWCQPCVGELTEWSERLGELGDDLQLVALSVDGLDDPDDPASRDDADAKKLATKLGLNDRAGMASPQLVESLQLVNNMVYTSDHRRLPIPTSVLINEQGRLVAIYKGQVGLDRVLSDAKKVRNGGAGDGLPFTGRWIAKPRSHNVEKLVARLWESGMSSSAISMAAKVDETSHRSERVKMHWANATRLRDADRAAEFGRELQSVLRLDPDHHLALAEMGIAHARQGNLQQAIVFFAKAAEQPDAEAATHFNYGKALRQSGQIVKAVAALTKAVQLDAKLAGPHRELAQIHVRKKDFQQAAKHFKAAWAERKENRSDLFNYVTALMGAGDGKNAREVLSRAVEINPTGMDERAYLGQVLVQLGDRAAAMEQFEEVVRLQPKATKIWFQLGTLARQQKKWDRAISSFRQVAQLIPNDPVVDAELATLLSTVPDPNLRDGKEAVQLAQRAVTATGRKDGMALAALATALAEVGDFERAAKVQAEALNQREITDGQRKEYESRMNQFQKRKAVRLENE